MDAANQSTSTFIEETPGVCGGDACIAGTRIPVWLLEFYRQQGKSEAELLEMFPSVPAETLPSAWSYVAAHADLIEQQIKENEE